MIHDLKILPCYFNASQKGIKPFEVRKNDRFYNEGDILHLMEYGKNEYDKWFYTGREIYKKVTYILNDSEYCKDGYVIMGVRNIRKVPIKEDKIDLLFV